VDALARYFEYWLLRREGGYTPLDVCPRCGRRALPDGAVLAMADRAYVCGECGHGGPRLSREAMSFLRTAAGRAPADVAVTGGPAAALREIEVVHDRLIAMHLEKELRSAKVVRQL
jgi:hypothetical protein